MKEKPAKWSWVTAGWLGMMFGIALAWFRGDFQQFDVRHSYANIAALGLGAAAGGAVLFMIAAAIRNLIVR